MKKILYTLSVAFALIVAGCTKLSENQAIVQPPDNQPDYVEANIMFSSGELMGINTEGSFVRSIGEDGITRMLRISGYADNKQYLEIELPPYWKPGVYLFGNAEATRTNKTAVCRLHMVGARYELDQDYSGTLTIEAISNDMIAGHFDVKLRDYSYYLSEERPSALAAGSFRGHFRILEVSDAIIGAREGR